MGGQEQSASLIQSASLKRKVFFDKEEEEREWLLPSAVQRRKETNPPVQEGSNGHTSPSHSSSSELPRSFPQLVLFSVARLSANSTRTLSDLWGGASHGLSRVALLLRDVAVGQTTLETVPTVVVLLGTALCLVGLGAGMCGAFPLAKDKDRSTATLGLEPPWKSALRAPSPPPGKRPQEAVAKRLAKSPASGEAAPRFLPPESTPVQSMLSVCRGSAVSSLADPQAAGSFLCPGLVVPEECECSLLVPRLEPRAENCEVTVDDAAGVPVFRVVYCLPSRNEASPTLPGKQGSTQRLDQDGNRCLVLSSSADDNTVFAFCRLGLNGALTILDAAEKPFGLIRMRVGKAGFEVATRLGSQVHLNLTEQNDLAATDRRGRTLALTEAVPGDALLRTVRIGPFVDAGLITLAILAVDLLQSMSS